MLAFLLQVAGMAPDDCTLSGLCALMAPKPPIAPGVMYTALGLVALGVWGYVRQRDGRPAASGTDTTPARDT